MDINIRESIINNFKNSNHLEIQESIDESIKNNEEITLPGLGVFFENLWLNSSTEEKNIILNILQKSFN